MPPALATAPPPARAASTSRMMTRPPGPLPATAPTSTPFWAAAFFASGEALIRPSADAAALGGAFAAGALDAAGADAGFDARGRSTTLSLLPSFSLLAAAALPPAL